jgi:hypothetical protein
MQDQRSGISEESAGIRPSILQTVDPNRSSTAVNPRGSRSLLSEERVAGLLPGEISKDQVSRSAVAHPREIPLPSCERTLPRPLNLNESAVREICKMLESILQSASVLDALSSDEIMLFILHHNWGFKLASQCVEVFGLDCRPGLIQWIETNFPASRLPAVPQDPTHDR